MIELLQQILGFIEAFGEFFFNLVESLFLAIETLSTAISLPVFLAGYLPTILASSLMIVTALAVVKFIVGR